MTAAAAVVAEGVEVRYHGGPQPAVRGAGLSLAPGEGLLVTGPPGAGKTSLLRALMGLVPAGGAIRVLGAPPGAPATRRRIGYGPGGDGYARDLTLREAVAAVAALRGGGPASAAGALERAGLTLVAGLRTERLDEEGFRRLSLAVAVACDPDVLVLDDAVPLPETIDEVRAARARGAAVIAAAEGPAGLAHALGGRLALADGVAR